MWLQEAMPSRRERVPLQLSPARAWGNAARCKPELLFAHSTTGLLVVTEVRWGGWERTRLRSGKRQNQSLGKQPWLAGVGEGTDVPRGCGGHTGGCTICSPGQPEEARSVSQVYGDCAALGQDTGVSPCGPQRPPPAPRTALLLKNHHSGLAVWGLLALSSPHASAGSRCPQPHAAGASPL